MSKCKLCFDTGCQCGGIGLTCHGCCSCEAGERARNNRDRALAEVAVLCGITKREGARRED